MVTAPRERPVHGISSPSPGICTPPSMPLTACLRLDGNENDAHLYRMQVQTLDQA
jgi:hypothetical protein